MDALYREAILDHYRYPRNKGHLETPDISYHDHNPFCGDEITIELKIEDGKVVEAAFCLLYTSPSPRDRTRSRMPSSA